MTTNSGSPLAEILENIQQLTKNAKSLCRTKKYALSVHVSILSIEESAKYLILFCRSHLPEEVFRKRFQHLNKHAVSRAPWFLAGQLSVVYMVHVASEMQQGDDDLAKSTRTFSKYISHYFYRNDPEAVARSILGVLDLKDDNIIKQNKNAIAEQERDRLSSVYVDISNDLEILSKPSEFDREKAKKYTDMAEFCMRVSQFVGTPSETISDFVEMLPPIERQRMKREARKHALDLIRR
ncbi:AbiV family abortive infection protein [Mesorhizobium sp. BR1-1-3]|uniref:AbiV family abortive infection protein n=1 Tax=Mesorhizobium sp. BR1-1-3 TaxID=2876651 RepID=UPI001CD0BB70|nr:AbiV family abortive infection protein [Mesorhizobium sp. BR1-1-3]MBZ9887963.1 AbiV family abortive infection protein [Mesorhizobium sp. BR1-1-3]